MGTNAKMVKNECVILLQYSERYIVMKVMCISPEDFIVLYVTLAFVGNFVVCTFYWPHTIRFVELHSGRGMARDTLRLYCLLKIMDGLGTDIVVQYLYTFRDCRFSSLNI